MSNLHKVALEELVEVPLSSRVREIPNIETTAFCNDGDDSFVLSCVDWFTTSNIVCSSCRLLYMVLDSSGSHGVGDSVDSRHVD